MISNILKKRDFPFIVFLGVPENILDLITFLLFTTYMILKYTLNFPIWADLIVAVIFIMIFLIFMKYNEDNKYKACIDHAKSFSIFFIGLFLLKFFL